MLAFALRRFVSMLLTLFAVSVLVFLIFFATPGTDPAARIAGRNASQQTLRQVRHDFGLDKPLPVQYVIMMRKLLITQDLASFVNRGNMVMPQVRAAAPVTISLVVGAAIIWVVLSLIMGLASVAFRGRILDPIIVVVGLIGVSMPAYWLGEVVNLITQSRLHDSVFWWVPPLGYTPFSVSPKLWFLQLLFPWLTLAFLYVGVYARVLRSNLFESMSEDFIRTARAKGLSERRVLMRHALRTSLTGFVTLFGLDFAALIGGAALLTEVVFSLPGIGKLTYDSLQNLDLPVIMACTLYAAFFVVLMNALVDLAYAWLDPRVRHG